MNLDFQKIRIFGTVFISLICIACSKSVPNNEAEASDIIVGTWSDDERCMPGKAVMTYYHDGNYFDGWNFSEKLSEGSWRIDGNTLILETQVVQYEGDSVETPSPETRTWKFSFTAEGSLRLEANDSTISLWHKCRKQDITNPQALVAAVNEPPATKNRNSGGTSNRAQSEINGPLDDQDNQLIEEWRQLNGRCRGGSGEDPDTWKACSLRTSFEPKLERRNLCYGKEGESGYQNEWHRCVANSIR